MTVTAMSAFEALTDLERICERLDKDFVKAQRFVRKLTEGLETVEAASVVKRLLEGDGASPKGGPMSVTEVLEQLAATVTSLDDEIAELTATLEQKTAEKKLAEAGLKALSTNGSTPKRSSGSEARGGGSRRSAKATVHQCPHCDKVTPTENGLKIHIGRAHKDLGEVAA